MRIEAIAIGDSPPDDVNVIIEVPVGGQPIKYELDKDAGILVVDRFLYTPMSYPGNYGFVPHTLSEDGDPIDVLVCNTRQLIPGCVINVRPIGALMMEDDSGMDAVMTASSTTPTCPISPCSRSSIFSSITRISNRENGSRSATGWMRKQPAA